jgi:hypothetical protein
MVLGGFQFSQGRKVLIDGIVMNIEVFAATFWPRCPIGRS